MPPELTVVLIGIAVAAGAGIQQLIKAVVKRQMSKMEETAAQALQDREAVRQRERESDLQKRLLLETELEKVKADASDAKVIGENLTNLTSAFLKSVDTYAKEQFANREALSNNTQTVGDLAQSIDRVGTILEENTGVSRSTGIKADNVAQAVSELFNRFAIVFPTDKPMDERFEELKQAIIEALETACAEKKQATQEVKVTVIAPSPDAGDAPGANDVDVLPKAG